MARAPNTGKSKKRSSSTSLLSVLEQDEDTPRNDKQQESSLSKKQKKSLRRSYFSEAIGRSKDEIMSKEPVQESTIITLRSTLSEIRTEKHIPPAKTFQGPATIEEIVGGKPDDQLLDSDFPKATLNPKVQLQYIVKPGSLPRMVEVERLRRAYLKQDLEEILLEKGIDYQKLIMWNKQSSIVKTEKGLEFTSYLPVELFDNDDLEVRSQDAWLSRAIVKGTRKALPGRAYLPTSSAESMQGELDEDLLTYAWQDVGVLDYNESERLWLVQTLNKNGRVLNKDEATFWKQGLQHFVELEKLSSSQWWIPRLRLKFIAEDAYQFADRINAALKARDEAERIIRYWLCVDGMPTDGMSSLDDEAVNRIIVRASNNSALKKWKDLPQMLAASIEEAKESYRRCMNRLLFDHVTTTDPELIGVVTSPQKPAYELKRSIISDFIPYSMPIIKRKFIFRSFLVFKEAIWTLYKIREECNKPLEMNLFVTNNPKSVKLEELEQAQAQATQQVHLFLKDSWGRNIIIAIRGFIQYVGKGWFNLNETNWQIYQMSKLKKFMTVVKFMMQDTLRFLVLASLRSFVQLFLDACKDTLDLADTYKWNTDLKKSPIKPKRYPIFSIDLIIDASGIRYGTELENFESSLVTLFTRGINATDTVQDVEKFVLTSLYWHETSMVDTVSMKEPEVLELQDLLVQTINQSFIPLRAYAQQYQQFMPLAKQELSHYVESYDETGDLVLMDIKWEIDRLIAEKNQLEHKLPKSITIGPFVVFVETSKQFLLKKCKALADGLLDYIMKRIRQRVEDVTAEFKRISRKLQDKPVTLEEIGDIRAWINSIPSTMASLSDQGKNVCTDFSIPDFFLRALNDDDFNEKASLITWPWKIQKQITECSQMLVEEEEKFARLLVLDQAALKDRLENLTMAIASLSCFNDLARAAEYANDIKRMIKSLRECQDLAVAYNRREMIIGVPVTNYEVIGKMVKLFDPYRNLWLTAADWQRWLDSWMTDPVFSIDPDALEKNVADSLKTMTKSLKAFAEAPDQLNMVTELKNQIEKFRPSVPLIQALRNPGMRPRHWEQLSREIGIKVVPKPNLSFAKCLDMGLGQYIPIVTAIGESAGKELQIESGLDKMESTWADVRFDISPYRTSGSYQMKINEEVQQLLDDQIVNTQTMTFSPFKKPFEVRLANWESRLKLVQEVLDQWLSAQRSWMYLEPIFSAEGIIRQLPMEGKKYQQMERHWKRIMNNANKNNDVLSFCHDPILLNNLMECNVLLEKVMKGLTDYLETKRSGFPRFYFLSDDELLEILSQTKNPLAVQPHLRKCFEAFAKLDFGPDLRIRGVQSFEGEHVGFTTKLYPVGGVEEWMSNLEDTMLESIRDILSNAFIDYAKNVRKKFVLIWPGQIVIAICQTYWTAEVEQGLVDGTLPDYLDLMYEQLDDLRELVRGELLRNERYTLSALIVIEVHSRDVVQGIVETKVSGVKDFDWIRQLRYYWVANHLFVRAVNAEFRYGYEYLGNTGRLVITPLTDRCYLTLIGALHLKFGGAPAGPAGTGKTETTKDLSKAMAIACVVFNCSDQLDYLAMGKFFKGLASSGAWACFDEFNRIDLEVLSVIAQQLQTINKAIVAKAKRFMFEGCEITLKETCASFITMNPGYAGRSELPDNLKALFRPVAMMVPDYALIAEISFFSFGFSNSRHLARKVTTTFKLASEQVSSQDHYDFGMRAVKTVIYAAGNLKREHPKMNEELIALRAIRDVNVPKFLQDDLKLFTGIVSDLFPSTPDEPIDYGKLENAIRSSCKQQFLKDVDGFVVKCIQLYDTTVVRHGLMLVGPAGSGKTKCSDVLKMAINELVGELNPGGTEYQVVHSISLNPKSITMGQLYGEFDSVTYEWTDGILPSLIRGGAIMQDDDKRWYIFDGPVDAVWIENMNSVLDDNKKLCLTSGEIIKLSDNQTLMFEVADLSVASPATVSRCGMIYLEPSILGLKPFVDCWIEFKLAPNARPYTSRLNNLFNAFLETSLQYMRLRVKEIVVSVNSNVAFSLMKLLGCLLRKLPPPHLVPEAKIKDVEGLVESLFVFALIWSVGATCDNDGRHKFNTWLRQKMALEQLHYEMPAEDTIYDYRVDDAGAITNITGNVPHAADAPPFQIWIGWLTNLPPYMILPTTKFSDILVPTPDTVRNTFIVETLLTNNFPVLAIGPTGTGKSATIKDKLSRGLPSTYIADFINFSARTSANQVQDLIDHKLDKRRKGIFGPPPGKIFIFFVDDMNMPAVEVYGAQPPIELLRQFMDYSGWYDRRSIGEFRRLIDVNFICAMGPPGGGRNNVTQRFLRHFSFLSYTDLEDKSMFQIFQTILQSWLETNPEMLTHAHQLVQSSITVYNTITTQLLPTPAKSHYTFNLRDVSKVFQGILMADPLVLQELPSFLRLWYHETSRVYQDRLINNEDRTWFQKLMDLRMQEDFDVPFDLVVIRQPILYADFLSANPEKKVYEEITDIDRLTSYLEDTLEDYNDNNVQQMNLVLFTDAIRHVCRIGRILKQPGGNGLLLGMGGSGRQSLTRLSAHLTEMECFQIELVKQYGMTEWREDLKKVMMKSGLKDRNLVFLFSDTQIKSEAFLEDINNVLNSGDVPNIFATEDLELIYQTVRQATVDASLVPTKSNMYSVLTKRVRANLHTFITMSPIGEIFRARLRQFPALVNCCTIDWFSEWPDAALLSVGMNFLDEMPNLEADDTTIRGAVAMCQLMHQTTISASERYFLELSRYNYVTPKSYLDLLAAFTVIHSVKCHTLKQAKIRMQTGLIKLKHTSDDIAEMQIELEELRPALVVAAKDTEAMRKKIAIDTAIAEETRIVVKKEEESATEIATRTQAITDDAQKDLDLALPALDAALSSLKNLNKNDVVELRSMKSPPAGIRLVMEAVCILKGIKPKLFPGEKPGTKVADYWEPSKILLQDPNRFLDSLFKFDRDNIPDEIIKKILPYIEDPSFLPEAISKVSKACTSICMWVRAMYRYSEVTKVVIPKREALAKAQAELAVTMEILAEAKGRLDFVESGLNALNEKLAENIRQKKELEDNSQLCEDRLIRADKLISGLEEERVRWVENVEVMQSQLDSVLGDVLVSSGSVAYLGPFTEEYRSNLTNEWIKNLAGNGVPHTSDPTLITTLGDAVRIRNWQIAGLPKDNLSVQNGVIAQYSQRWSLFIDPQGQANKWIKNMEKDAGLIVFKMADKDILKPLENAIRYGKPALMEHVGAEIDPSLDPVLLKQTFRQEGTVMIKLGENVIPYDNHFKLYMTTKLPNPHYAPEIAIKVTILNFTLSPSGLEDQLLALVVAEERQDLEEAKNELIINNAKMKQELKDLEDQILLRLNASEGNPVDDVEFIEILEASKKKSAEIKARVSVAEATEKSIDETRSRYIPVAVRAQILFFCMSGLAVIDPMYQYSLEWFQGNFVTSIKEADRSANLATRIDNINSHFTFNLFTSVCRSLFEKHKLMFAFLMATRIQMNRKLIDMGEWRFLLAGGNPVELLPNANSKWISERSWNEILSLAALPTFKNITTFFRDESDQFKIIFDAVDPHRVSFPEPWEKDLSIFQKLLILRALRPDKVMNAFQDYVAAILGQRFIEPQTNDLMSVFKESSSTIPLVFVLSAGTDPGGDLNKFAEKMKFGKKLGVISLGQGQGPRAENMMRFAMEAGQWVFLQNCHLAPSWMPTFERLVEQINPDVCHVDFRLWSTSMPSPDFPVYILQNGCKMTVEPPRGIKANLLKVYYDFTDEYLESCTTKPQEFKCLLFSLALFHSVLVERRKFGSIGFNIAYDFTDGDLDICISQLFMFLTEYEEIAFKVLKYTAGEVNYGGRVTDDWDRRTVMSILEGYYNMEVLDKNHSFDSFNIYHQTDPETTFAADYMEYIRGLPINDTPDIFGLHENANIVYAQNELFLNLNYLLLQQPKTVGGQQGGATREDIIQSSAMYILDVILQPFELEPIQEQYPITYEEAMNTVLIQELLRYNKILGEIHRSLRSLLKALKGLLVMTDELEDTSTALFNNLVPNTWKKKSYPSLKPLASWVVDLRARMNFFSSWVDKGTPNAFWISGLWFPQAFITGTTQNFARKKKIEIDKISFGFEVLREPKEKLRRPDIGCYVYGLYIEGARWDSQLYYLVEANPKELYTEMPCFWFVPTENREPPTENYYMSPIYKTLTRAGTLTTSGHSTNFILPVEIPSNKPQSHWVKRSVALICALDY